MQARFPGTCRDCGNRFPAGTDIDWQKGQGASCCNGTPASITVVHAEPLAPQEDRAWGGYDRAFIVDGAMKMEWVEEKTYQEGVGFQADTVIYEERVYSGYNWMCFECKLVWDKQHQAKGCGSRGHVSTYEDTYGVREVRNGVPTGPNVYTITRWAIRLEKSKDTPPVAPAPQHITGCDGNHTGEHCVLDIGPYITQVDMTSEEMWEFMTSVNHPSITTTWN